MKSIIKYFSHHHLFANFLYLVVLTSGVFFWQITQKEELPEMEFDTVRISVSYPGASPSEVEKSVTWPIEKELQNVDGIEEVLSTSSEGNSSITVELQENNPDRDNIISEIRNAVLSVNLPAEVLDTPGIREFKSSKKTIIDMGIYFKEQKYLTTLDRKRLQTIAHSLENRLVNLPQINSVSKRGYLKEELQIKMIPGLLSVYQIPIRTILSAINDANVRQPAGTLENSDEERITLDGEITQKEALENLPVRGSFDGPVLRLGSLGVVEDGYEKTTNIHKINGHEGIIFSVVKNTDTGILDAVDKVKEEVIRFASDNPERENVQIIFFDDESKDVRNRIDIIKGNGLFGFILIVSSLFIFLNFKAGFWVATGIPFSFGLTLVISNLIGYTINNMTLAGIIIVMGMVVDDAIVVAENITRIESRGVPRARAVVEGTSMVILPITAAVLTTVAAFLPLWTFEGRLSKLVEPIPMIVALMLFASLVESIFVLPAHMNQETPRWVKIVFSLGLILLIEKFFHKNADASPQREYNALWFEAVEHKFYLHLKKMLQWNYLIIGFFLVFSFTGFFILKKFMKFSLFPREEVKEVQINAEAPEGTQKLQTALMAEKLEEIFVPYLGKDIDAFFTYTGMKHFSIPGQENQIWMRIELKDKGERKTSFKKLMAQWRQKMDIVEGLQNVQFSKRRFGVSSGSPVEILVQENDNVLREKITNALMDQLKGHPHLVSVKSGEAYKSPEYTVEIKRDLAKRLGVDAAEIGITLRSALDGVVLYRFLIGDEEKDVRISMQTRYKQNLDQILNTPVHNNSGYMVPVRNLVSVEKVTSPQEIQRMNRQRITRVYADIKSESGLTPLDIAEDLEKNIFPRITKLSKTANLSFDGEIQETRESSGYLPMAMGMIIFLIYIILALQFESTSLPLIILTTIFPALASVVFIFLLHGMSQYGFFGMIGGLGLVGVVVNDAIVLVDSLRKALKDKGYNMDNDTIARITSTRLRAVTLTTITTVAGLLPTAYGVMGYDSMLSELMIALAWGLMFGTTITLILVPSLFKAIISVRRYLGNVGNEIL